MSTHEDLLEEARKIRNDMHEMVAYLDDFRNKAKQMVAEEFRALYPSVADELSTLTNRYEAIIKDKLEGLKESIDEMETSFHEKFNEIAQHKITLVNELESINNRIENYLESVNTSFEELIDLHSEKIRKLNIEMLDVYQEDLKSNMDTFSDKLDSNINEKIKEFESNIDEQLKEIESLEELLVDNKAQFNAVNIQIQAAKSDFESFLADINSKIEDKTQEYSLILQEFTNDKLSDIDNKKNSIIEESVNNISSYIIDKQKDIDIKSEEISDKYDRKIADFKNNIDEVYSLYESLNINNNELKEEIKNIKTSIEEALENYSSLIVSKYKNYCEIIDKKHNDIIGIFKNNEEISNNLNSKIEETLKQNDELKDIIISNKDRNKELEKEILVVKNDSDIMKESIELLKAEQTTMLDKMSKLSNKTISISEEIIPFIQQGLSNKLKSVGEKNKVLEDHISLLQTTLATKEEKEQKMEATIEMMGKKLSKHNIFLWISLGLSLFVVYGLIMVLVI